VAEPSSLSPESGADEPVYRITLVRHGESVGNALDRLQGREDFPLSDQGRAQAATLGRHLRSEAITFDHVIASPLQRARETAGIIATVLDLPDPEIEALWIEQDLGEGPARREEQPGVGCERADSGPLRFVPRESDATLLARGRVALQSLLARPPARYLVVSHRAILNAAICAMLDLAPPRDIGPGALFRLRNASYSRFRYFPRSLRWQVDVIGDRSHWTGRGSMGSS